MLSPRKYRRLAVESAKEAARTSDDQRKRQLVKEARLRIRAAEHLERLGFGREAPAKPPGNRSGSTRRFAGRRDT
jgi:hypothetical protein